MPLDLALHMVKMVNFTSRVFYHRKRKDSQALTKISK